MATRTSKSNNARTATQSTSRARPARTSRSSRTGTAAIAKTVSTELSATRRVLAKSRVAVPLLVAVGLGAAVVRKVLRGRNNASAFQRTVKHLPAKVGEAIQALAALGRDVRSSVSR